MPWIALAPDISGVCSVEETLEITSMPTKTLSTKIVSQTTGLAHGGLSPPGRARVGSCRIAPSCVTQDPATISSSKSGAKRALVGRSSA